MLAGGQRLVCWWEDRDLCVGGRTRTQRLACPALSFQALAALLRLLPRALACLESSLCSPFRFNQGRIPSFEYHFGAHKTVELIKETFDFDL